MTNRKRPLNQSVVLVQKKIRELVSALGMRQVDLANAAGLAENSVSQILNENPSVCKKLPVDVIAGMKKLRPDLDLNKLFDPKTSAQQCVNAGGKV